MAIIFAIAISAPAFADRPNPFFFGDTQNQMGVQLGQSAGPGAILTIIPGNGWDLEPFQVIALQYSQPTEFFRLPARLNLHAGFFVAWNNMADDYNDPFAGASLDVAFFQWDDFYLGAGLGGYIKPTYDGRMDSLLMFGTKIFLGYRFADLWSVEIYSQHMDNAGLMAVNGGYNFFGLQVLRNF